MPRTRKPSTDGTQDAAPSLPRTASVAAYGEAGAAQPVLPLASVVKLFTVASKPNYTMPWQMSKQEHYTGSGFVISGRRIITNAHVVSDYTVVRVRRHGGQINFKAKVLHINHVCDLAMVTVPDDAFWEGLPVLEVAAEVPSLDERVMVLGYPMGGETISVTRGIVSRITTLIYDENKAFQRRLPELLAVQIDAAINSGNSGGPVLRENGQLVGVAFSGYAGSADNIGYIIPTTVLESFLESIRRLGKSELICDLGITYERCENPCLQRVLKLGDKLTGVRVAKIDELNASAGKLLENDVLLTLNKYNIANDGTVAFRGEERVSFQHLITSNPVGKTLEVEVLRDGKKLTVQIEGQTNPQLVPLHRLPGEMPSYMIVGGLLFTTVTMGLISMAVDEFDEDSWHATLQGKKNPEQQLVVLLAVLAHPINHGYETRRIHQLASCNGEKVLNIRHLKRLVDESKDVVQFKLTSGKIMVFDMKECAETEEEILETYAVPCPFSEDLGCPPPHETTKAKTQGRLPKAAAIKGKTTARKAGKARASAKATATKGKSKAADGVDGAMAAETDAASEDGKEPAAVAVGAAQNGKSGKRTPKGKANGVAGKRPKKVK